MTSLNTRLAVAKSVAEPLIELEQQVDTSLGTLTTVLNAVIAGREKARLPLHAGQEGIERIAAAASSLIAARKAIHEAHYAFRDVQEQMGLGAVAYGDHGDTPKVFTGQLGDVVTPELAIVRAA